MNRPPRNIRRETWVARLLIATVCIVLLAAVYFVGKADGAMTRAKLERRVSKSQYVLRFFETRSWMPALAVESCLQIAWTRTCIRARERIRFHERRLHVIRPMLFRWLPNTNDFVTAVRIAQRPYPGTGYWLLNCSGAESSHGRPRWHSDSGLWWDPAVGHVGYDSTGDVVFGNMQFRYTTFLPYWRQTLRDLARRGFTPPNLGWARPRVVVGASTGYGPWLSPLGQALVAGYMRYYDKDGSHWSASSGNGC